MESGTSIPTQAPPATDTPTPNQEPTAALTEPPTDTPEPMRPNILVIMSDDQRFDTMEYMPLTRKWIFDQGITFTRGYVTTPSCCPSRASFFTGLYAFKHGVKHSQDDLMLPTFIDALHAAGYSTGLVGKYLNSWDGSRRAEFDYWVSFNGGGSPYSDPELNIQGEWRSFEGYITDILRDHALEFIYAVAEQAQPFVLVFAPTAPHDPADPAPGDEALYPDLAPFRPPSYDEEDVSDKPSWVSEYNRVSASWQVQIDAFRRRQLQSLHSLDQTVDSLLSALQITGQLDQTLIVYFSDNGIFWGEHRLRRGKTYAYEEAIHVPFAIRYPALAPQARQEARLIANIDLAPTFYELAGLPIPAGTDGLSLLPLLQDRAKEWRSQILIENWDARYGNYIAVRSERYLYVEWEDYQRRELYDTAEDPFELDNLSKKEDSQPIIAEMQQFIRAVRGKSSE